MIDRLHKMNDIDSRNKILNTAIKLFSTKGFRETSVREISREAGVNVSMVSYYFGGKDGLLETIINEIADLFASHINSFDLENLEKLIGDFESFLLALEQRRAQIKILFSEMGKGHNYLLPVKNKIIELQANLAGFIRSPADDISDSLLRRKLHIMTDIILGMIFSDFIIDFSSFQEDIGNREKKLWREERIRMLIKMLRQISGFDSGRLTFVPILEGDA